MEEQETKRNIQLAAFSFDPLTEMPGLPDNLRVAPPPKAPVPTIVQFKKPLTRQEQAHIQGKYGLKLAAYVPEFAYLEQLGDDMLQRLVKEPLFRASVPFQPAFKIAPGIGELAFRSPKRQQMSGYWLRCLLFSSAEPLMVAERLKALGATDAQLIDDRKIGGSAQVLFTIQSLDLLPRIAQIEAVQWIEEVSENIEDNVNAAGTIQTGIANNPAIWNQGLHGEGQVIGLIDSGPPDINHCFFDDPANNTPSLAHRKILQIRNVSAVAVSDHATFTAGCAAGDDFNIPGSAARRGGAWAARLVCGNYQDAQGTSMLSELNAAADMGAFIHTNSWHENTGIPAKYNQTAADVDTFTWNNEDHLVLGSAGNVGEEQGPPGTAKNAVCVGASQADPNEMNFGDGNSGPTKDGRRKPDLMSPGCGIQSAIANTACGTGPRSACATSYATPHAAAAAVLARQYFSEGWYPTGSPQPNHAFVPSGVLLKALLLNSTIDMTGIPGYPNDQEGWGLVQLDNSLFFPGSARDLRVWDTRNADGLFTGETREHHLDVATNTQFLKVTLAWSDAPATAGSSSPVVNNLNLEVVSPDGTQTFLGNVFASGASVTGGAADTLNNVEMVLINTPAAGDWTIRVIGTTVNVGKPGQGYAIVATADMPEPPVSTGEQDTLVVRVKFADIAFEAPLPNLQNLMAEVGSYISEVSYGQASIVPAFRGPIKLNHNKDYYYHPDRNLLIELTEEVVGKLVASEPDIFNDYERMIVVTNDINFTGDWATTGPWPYNLPAGFTRPISVSVQSYANTVARFSHGMLHHFGLVDLYPHKGVSFPRPYVDKWDNMAGFYNNAHPLVWSKERAGWLSTHGDTITYIPRPADGASYSGMNPIPIFYNTSTAANRKAIAIGLSEGTNTLAQENIFYFVEARSNASGTADSALPGSGVLIYYVNEMIAQGEGPVILRDKNLLTQGLGDAFYSLDDVITIPGTGLTLTIQAGTDGAAYNIHIDYTAPATDYNVYITRGDTINGQFYSYYSPDIWVDSPRNGFNLSGGPQPHDQREKPVAGQVNRIYARVHNSGPATAFDFDVRFRISEPYHTVGGDADFDKFVGIRHIDSLPPGHVDVFVEWTPILTDDLHACVKVDLINLVGNDTNPNDNWAQENLDIATSVTSSPFRPVSSNYYLTNPYKEPALFYFRLDGAPKDWKIDLSPRKIRLNPGERTVGQVTITPPENAVVCTSEYMQITTWTPRGDTMINVGGAVLQVDLRRPTAMTFAAIALPCENRDMDILRSQRLQNPMANSQSVRQRCTRVVAQGCLVPPMAGKEVILKYVDPVGNVKYHTVKTDQNGCYEDFMVSVTDGTWQVSAEFPGGNCEAPVVKGPVTVTGQCQACFGVCRLLLIISSLFIAAALVIGSGTPTAAIQLFKSNQVFLLLAVILSFLALTLYLWWQACRPTVCQFLRALLYGSALGSLGLALILLFGHPEPRPVPAFLFSTGLLLATAIVMWAKGCWK